jgi:acid stress chaperone HdeB
MKALFLTVTLLAAVFVAGPASADDNLKVDVTKLTCGDFIKYSDEDRAIIMMWFEGYYTVGNQPTIIDFGTMATHLAKLLGVCQADPDEKMLEAAQKVMGK